MPTRPAREIERPAERIGDVRDQHAARSAVRNAAMESARLSHHGRRAPTRERSGDHEEHRIQRSVDRGLSTARQRGGLRRGPAACGRGGAAGEERGHRAARKAARDQPERRALRCLLRTRRRRLRLARLAPGGVVPWPPRRPLPRRVHRRNIEPERLGDRHARRVLGDDGDDNHDADRPTAQLTRMQPREARSRNRAPKKTSSSSRLRRSAWRT